MNDPNFNKRAFTEIVARLQSMGAEARLPVPGEGPDVYLAQLMNWMLDVCQPKARAAALSYYNRGFSGPVGKPNDVSVLIDHEADKLQRGERIQIETAKPHISGGPGGKSMRIEGVVVDGETYKPGEPLPPKDGQ